MSKQCQTDDDDNNKIALHQLSLKLPLFLVFAKNQIILKIHEFEVVERIQQ